jgi:hypothetical protein
MTDQPLAKHNELGDNEKDKDDIKKNSDRKKGSNILGQNNQLNKKVKDANERIGNETYKTTNKDNEKKSIAAGKGGSNTSKEIYLHHSYQAMLSQHINSNYENSNRLPAEALIQFGLTT